MIIEIENSNCLKGVKFMFENGVKELISSNQEDCICVEGDNDCGNRLQHESEYTLSYHPEGYGQGNQYSAEKGYGRVNACFHHNYTETCIFGELYSENIHLNDSQEQAEENASPLSTSLTEVKEVPVCIGIDPFIAELNKSHFVVMIDGNFRVANIEVDTVRGGTRLSLSSCASLKQRYSNRLIEIGKGKKPLPLGNYWLDHPHRRQYENIVFEPSEDVQNSYNLWQGFSVKPKKGSCDLFLAHIKENIAKGDLDIYNYVLAWLATMFQKPTYRAGVALILRGKEGTGKGVLAKYVGELLGSHYVYLNDPKQLTARENAYLDSSIFIYADEAFWSASNTNSGVLKSLITEDYILVKKMYKDSQLIKNYIHLIAASNEEWVIPAGLNERRFCVLDVGVDHQKDFEYFGAIAAQMDNGGSEALLHFLLNYDLSGVDIREFPQTEALLENKLLSMDVVSKFWYEKLINGTLISEQGSWNEEFVSAKDLHKDFVEFANDCGGRNLVNASHFSRKLLKILPVKNLSRKRIQIDGKKVLMYEFPSLEKCRSRFEELINFKIDWQKV